MKRRILLVDDDVAVLLTFKAVLEISGFEVDTAASAREGKSLIRSREYHMIISDMRMENDIAGTEVIQAARTAPYHPAIALLTAFPVDNEGWDGVGPDKILVKATHTRILLQQIDKLFASHSAKLARLSAQAAGPMNGTSVAPANGSKSGKSRSASAKAKSVSATAARSKPVPKAKTKAPAKTGSKSKKSSSGAALTA